MEKKFNATRIVFGIELAPTYRPHMSKNGSTSFFSLVPTLTQKKLVGVDPCHFCGDFQFFLLGSQKMHISWSNQTCCFKNRGVGASDLKISQVVLNSMFFMPSIPFLGVMNIFWDFSENSYFSRFPVSCSASVFTLWLGEREVPILPMFGVITLQKEYLRKFLKTPLESSHRDASIALCFSWNG